MRNRLTATARKIMVPECLLVNDTEALAAFRGDIDVTISRERRRGHEEHVLIHDLGMKGRWNVFVEDTHGCLCW